MLVTAAFVGVKTQKHPRYLPVDEDILWYVQKGEYTSALERAELSSHERQGRILNVYG